MMYAHTHTHTHTFKGTLYVLPAYVLGTKSYICLVIIAFIFVRAGANVPIHVYWRPSSV